MLWRFRREIVFIAGALLSILILRFHHAHRPAAERLATAHDQATEEREVFLENRRLRQLLAMKERGLPFSEVLFADVVSVKPDVYPGEITVNKGSRDGVRQNMVMLSTEGCLVGRIVAVEEDSATGITLYHAQAKVSVIDQSTREDGIVEGGTFPYIAMKYLLRDAHAQEGDIVVTSGKSEFYPKGLRVGEIRKSEKPKEQFFRKVWVFPYAGRTHLEEVCLGK